MFRRWLARQFAQPSGQIGRLVIAPWLDRISGPINGLVLDQLDLQRDDRVLEVGFGGGGLISSILAATADEVTGIDPSRDMVIRARRRFRRFARLRLHVASVEAMPIGDASIDKACSVESVYFWPDPAAAMAELARVVRPGGRLVIGFERPDELRKWPGHRFGFRPFEESELRALMTAAGFGDLNCVEGVGRRPDRFCALTGNRTQWQP